MTPKDAFEVAGSVILSLGGGGAIVLGLSGYLGKVWADRGLEKQRQEYTRLNLEFNHKLDLASRRIQMQLDTLGHLYKLQTESEFHKISELWKKLSYLRTAFSCIPRHGFALVSPDPQIRHDAHVRASNRFIASWNEAYETWSAETLSIPKNISNATGALLNIANLELFNAIEYPDPFDGTSMVMFDAVGRQQFFDDRTNRLNDFITKSENLQTMMRDYLQVPSDPGGNA
jgi:hypothetical protein